MGGSFITDRQSWTYLDGKIRRDWRVQDAVVPAEVRKVNRAWRKQ